VPAPDAAPATSEALSVEAIVEQVRRLRRRNAADIARRLGLGERLNAEQLYDILHAQTLATWWLLVDRHIQHARDGRGLTPEQTVNRFVSWISPYLDDDATEFDTAMTVRALGVQSGHELALAHFDQALALIRQDAARTFFAQVKRLASAFAEQASSTSTEQEARA
jgi:hypothetical protein